MRQTKFNDGQWIFNNDANPSEVIKKILRIFLYGKGAESGLISVDQNHNAKRLSITSINPVILSSAIFYGEFVLKTDNKINYFAGERSRSTTTLRRAFTRIRNELNNGKDVFEDGFVTWFSYMNLVMSLNNLEIILKTVSKEVIVNDEKQLLSELASKRVGDVDDDLSYPLNLRTFNNLTSLGKSIKMADSIINNNKEVNNSRDRVQHANGTESTNQSSIENDEAVNDEDIDTSKDMKITLKIPSFNKRKREDDNSTFADPENQRKELIRKLSLNLFPLSLLKHLVKHRDNVRKMEQRVIEIIGEDSFYQKFKNNVSWGSIIQAFSGTDPDEDDAGRVSNGMAHIKRAGFKFPDNAIPNEVKEVLGNIKSLN